MKNKEEVQQTPITEINSKPFVLQIVRLALIAVVGILLLVLPGQGTPMFIHLYYAVLILGSGEGGINIVIGILAGIPSLIFLAFYIVALVKNILALLAVVKTRKGKKEYSDVQWKKKFKLSGFVLSGIFYCVFLLFYSEFKCFDVIPLYLAIVLIIVDSVLLSMEKKNILGSSKEKKI